MYKAGVYESKLVCHVCCSVRLTVAVNRTAIPLVGQWWLPGDEDAIIALQVDAERV